MRRLVYAPAARKDLAEIADRLSEYDPDRALSFVRALESRAAKAAEQPFIYPKRDDIAPDVRSIPYRPYLILFEVSESEVVILRIVHGARELNALWLT